MVHMLHRRLLDVGQGLVDDVLAVLVAQEGGDLDYQGHQAT